MKKALIISTVIGFIVNFELNDIEILQKLDYEVHCATNYNTPCDIVKYNKFKQMNIIQHQINFTRNPLSIENIHAYIDLKHLIIWGKFDIIHCHTPVGGVLGRIATINVKTCKVLYTAHGFHFYKGAPLLNWMLYYHVEKILSKYTDALITINNYDYHIAKSKFNAKSTYRIHGVGIDLEKFNPNNVNRNTIREEFKIKPKEKLIVSVGELSKDKNQMCILKTINRLKKTNHKNYICLIAGSGPLENQLNKYIKKHNISSNVKLIGYRTDIQELLSAADIFIFSSKFEGLPVALMEAIAMKKFIICSKVRGNEDIVIDNHCFFKYNDDRNAAYKIINTSDNIIEESIKKNYENLEKFSLNSVNKEMERIYKVIDESVDKESVT